jgi:gas vesicle protein
MNTFLAGVFAGIVLGAAAAEVIRRQKPESLDGIGEKVKARASSLKGSFDAAKQAFVKGYEEVAAKA